MHKHMHTHIPHLMQRPMHRATPPPLPTTYLSLGCRDACQHLQAGKGWKVLGCKQVAAGAMHGMVVAGAGALLRPEVHRLQPVGQRGASADAGGSIHLDLVPLHQELGPCLPQLLREAHHLCRCPQVHTGGLSCRHR